KGRAGNVRARTGRGEDHFFRSNRITWSGTALNSMLPKPDRHAGDERHFDPERADRDAPFSAPGTAVERASATPHNGADARGHAAGERRARQMPDHFRGR